MQKIRSSFIRTLTVGSGIAPDRHPFWVFADCHRRWGIAPRPEDLVFSIAHRRKMSRKEYKAPVKRRSFTGERFRSYKVFLVGRDRQSVASLVFGMPLMSVYPMEGNGVFLQEREQFFP